MFKAMLGYLENKMAMKEWFRQMQPMRIYVILALTIAFFITELIVSHLTHALTLLMDSYHTLCNIFALSACMVTIKYGKQPPTDNSSDEPSESNPSPEELQKEPHKSVCSDKTLSTNNQQERTLKNTFGWARIDVIGMLICCVFLASLCFSIWVEALQTLIHIDHHDEMHHPIPVLCIGAAGLVLNGICFFLIGGFTFHQGSFLYMTESGCVVLNRVVTGDLLYKGERRLSRTRTVPPPRYRQRQGIREMLRDIVGCVFVIICAILVYYTEEDIAKYIDPALSMVSAAALMFLSYPYMKESCLILLQTIPDTINIDSLRAQLLQHFPDIVNVHDLHIWQLTATKVISTAHIIFKNPAVYLKITDKVSDFFLEHGVTQVIIQPEFFTKSNSSNSLQSSCSLPICLMQCQSEGCKESHCCREYEPRGLTITSKWKSLSKELIMTEPSDIKVLTLKQLQKEENHSDKEKTEKADLEAETQTSNNTDPIEEVV